MNTEKEFIEINLKQIVDALLARLGLVIVVTFMFGVIAFLYSKFAIVPLYATEATLYVNNNKNVISENIGVNEIDTSSLMANVYVEMLSSNAIMYEVLEQTGLDYSVNELKSMVSASAVNETPIMRVVVVSPYPKEAVVISNAILDIAPEKMTDYMDGGSVKVIDRPELPESPSSPNVSRNTFLGLVLGFAICAGLIVLMEMLDTRIRDEEQIKELFDLPVLGVIPEIDVDEE